MGYTSSVDNFIFSTLTSSSSTYSAYLQHGTSFSNIKIATISLSSVSNINSILYANIDLNLSYAFAAGENETTSYVSCYLSNIQQAERLYLGSLNITENTSIEYASIDKWSVNITSSGFYYKLTDETTLEIYGNVGLFFYYSSDFIFKSVPTGWYLNISTAYPRIRVMMQPTYHILMSCDV